MLLKNGHGFSPKSALFRAMHRPLLFAGHCLRSGCLHLGRVSLAVTLSSLMRYVGKLSTSLSFIFSASITPASCATALAALKVLREHPELPENLRAISARARKGLIDRGVKIRMSDTPIIPIYTYDPDSTLIRAKQVYEAGVYVKPVLPPATAPTACLLRTSYMANLTEALVDEAVEIIADVLATPIAL